MLVIKIGTDDFRKYRDQDGYFVDKSLLIKEVIDGSDVLLLPRPRRFGKTLNLSMLRYFFEKSEEDCHYLFEDLEIARSGHHYMNHQGQFPVIHISLKDMRGPDWMSAYRKIQDRISILFRQHEVVKNVLHEEQLEKFDSICRQKAEQSILELSLRDLVQYLYNYHQKPVVILIDEYDSPLIDAYYNGYVDQMIDFMRAWLSGGLKHEEGSAIYRAVVTGILRIARESIFSGLNNLDVWTTLVPGTFGDKFGFTEQEVLAILKDFKYEHKMDDIRRWYNGYTFGDNTLYNPWSVMNGIKRLPAEIGPQWLNTSASILVYKELEAGGFELKRDLEKLLSGASLRTYINETIISSDMNKNRQAIWSLLYFSGYLKADKPRVNPRTQMLTYRLAVPNREVMEVYRNFILYWHGQIKFGQTDALLAALIEVRLEECQRLLQDLVLKLLSYHDMSHFPEAFYHAFVLGLLANLGEVYEIRSNAESGFGRADILMHPKSKQFPEAFVIEFKSVKERGDVNKAVDTAFKQIETNVYSAQLQHAGIADAHIHKLAIVIQGKHVHLEEA